MAGKHAKTILKQHLTTALWRVADSRYPERARVMVLLSVRAGLRAGEIAKLTWPMVVDAQGRVASHIELPSASGPDAVAAAASQTKCSTWPRNPVGARRGAAPEHRRELVRPALSRAWIRGLHITLGAPHL